MTGFTAEELEEMRKADAEIDAEPEDPRALWDEQRLIARINKSEQLYPHGWTKDKKFVAAYKHEHYLAHKAESRANKRKWYAAHIEQERAKARERYRKRREASKCAPSSVGQSGK